MLNITFLSNFYKDPIINILQLTGHAMNNEAITDYSAVTRKKINEILSKDEIRALTTRSDLARQSTGQLTPRIRLRYELSHEN